MTKKLDELVDQEYDLTDWRNQLTVLHALQVQAQALIDMCQRLLSNMGVASEGYVRLAVRLRENGLVTSEEEAFIRSIIGFRNIIVHGYATLDIGVINEILKSRDYRRILELALRLKDRAKEYWDP
nr:HepT-like ribonuclease domain-containing protein [Caldivirga sp.]